MMSAPTLTTWSYAVLELCAAAGLCLQVIHAVLVASMRPRGRRLWPLLSGACLVMHLSLAADMLASISWQASPLLAETLEARGMLPVLWTNLPLAATMGVAACLLDERSGWAVAILATMSTPPVVNALGPWWNVVAAGDLLSSLVFGKTQLRRDIKLRHAMPTSASVAEAMNVISVGMLVTDGHGASLFMNDAMRSELEGFGFPTDLGNLSQVWEDVRAYAVTLHDLGVRDDALPSPPLKTAPDRMLVQAPDGRVILALLEPPADGRNGTRVFSLDITRLVDAAQSLSRANDALEQANAELNEQLASVRAVARQSAFLRMRANVHDVIGQRLSLLQRYLDAGMVDERSLAQLRDLMESVLHDLRETPEADPIESFGDVVDAFALVDVNVVVRGELPADLAVSDTLARITREACTNSCRHAQAQTVWVDLGEEKHEGLRWTTLEIHDDGDSSRTSAGGNADPIREGTGIAGMRGAVEKLHGVFSVRPGPPFTISVRIPLP